MSRSRPARRTPARHQVLRSVPGSWARVASTWCVVFAALHVFWALGGDAGLAESAGADLATRRPTVFVVFGLWGVAALLVMGALLGGSIARPRAPGWPRRLMVLAGLLVGTSLLVRGVGLELVLLFDAGGIASSVGEGQARWSLLLWNPWFMLGGTAFLLAVRRFARMSGR